MLQLRIRLLAFSLLLLATTGGSATVAQNIPSNDVFNIEDYAGQVVYVDFWASWCGPCRASFPFMADLSARFGDDLRIIAINVDENKEEALAFLEAFDVPFDIIYDPEGELAAGFDLPGMPSTFLFDRSGNLVMKHVAFKQSHVEGLIQRVAQTISAPLVELGNE